MKKKRSNISSSTAKIQFVLRLFVSASSMQFGSIESSICFPIPSFFPSFPTSFDTIDHQMNRWSENIRIIIFHKINE